MANIYIIIIYFLINLTSISAIASNSFADCQAIAAKFNSATKNITCHGFTNTAMCPGTIISNSNGECIFQHILSVTCINGTVVRIHIESNGLPPFCPNLNGNYPFIKQNISFTVNFNPDVSIKQLQYNPITQTALNAIVCNASSTKSVPINANLTINNNNITTIDEIVGVSVDGVAIFNALNNNIEDVFYPKITNLTESIDQCLARTQSNGIYHYRIGSSCPLDSPLGQTTTCKNIPTCGASVANYSTSMFINHKNLTVIGIAKDGHIIYGPYTSDGKLITDGFDICNGMFFDSIGNYGYFSTNTFPYIIGCFGPGNYPENLLPNCTTNPPIPYKKSIYAEVLSSVNSGNLMIPFNFILLSTTTMTLITKYY